MLLKQFHKLTEGKCRHLLVDGVCVAERFTKSEDGLLFQLSDCYVEVVFYRQSDQIIRVRCFQDTNALEPYLVEINIETLLK